MKWNCRLNWTMYLTKMNNNKQVILTKIHVKLNDYYLVIILMYSFLINRLVSCNLQNMYILFYKYVSVWRFILNIMFFIMLSGFIVLYCVS